jgi:DNA-binding transcriptional ArsR family regulator
MTDLVRTLKALSSEPRLKILRLLKERSLCVSAITAKFGMTQSAVSQHLRVLKEAGLVKAEKRGYWMHYAAKRDQLRRYGNLIGKLFEVTG